MVSKRDNGKLISLILNSLFINGILTISQSYFALFIERCELVLKLLFHSFGNILVRNILVDLSVLIRYRYLRIDDRDIMPNSISDYNLDRSITYVLAILNPPQNGLNNSSKSYLCQVKSLRNLHEQLLRPSPLEAIIESHYMLYKAFCDVIKFTLILGISTAVFSQNMIIQDASAASVDSSFMDSLGDLLNDEANLLSSFDYLIHNTTTTTEERVGFIDSFDDLLRRQATLFSGFDDLLKTHWNSMDIEEQEKFLNNFKDLLKRESTLYYKLESLNEESWQDISSEKRVELLASFGDLLKKQADLLIAYEELLKNKVGGLTIANSVNKPIIDQGEKVTYTYVIKNWYKKAVKDVVIIDDKLGTVADKVSLNPGESKSFTKSVNIYDDACNTATVLGKDPDGNITADDSGLVYVRVRGGGLSEPAQYGQYCDSQKIVGTGIVDVNTAIVDKDIALEYRNNMAGDGDIEYNSEHVLSENASKLQRPVNGKTVPLNFFEENKLSYAGSHPLAGQKQINSREFDGGIGANVEENFLANQIDKDQTTFFASTDPAGHISNYTQAKKIDRITPVYLIGTNISSQFNGTWGTGTTWYNVLKKKIFDRQSFTGDFEAQKLIEIHESPRPEPQATQCEGIDC